MDVGHIAYIIQYLKILQINIDVTIYIYISFIYFYNVFYNDYLYSI